MDPKNREIFENDDTREAQRLFDSSLHKKLARAPLGYQIGIDLTTKRGYVAPTLPQLLAQARKHNPRAKMMVKEAGGQMPWGRMFLAPEAEELLKRFAAGEVTLFTVVHKDKLRPAMFSKLDDAIAILFFPTREFAAKYASDLDFVRIAEMGWEDFQQMRTQNPQEERSWGVRVLIPPSV